MKKLLFIIALSLLICENSFAGCKQDVNFSWWKKGQGTDFEAVWFQFHNKKSKHIRITHIWVSDSERDKIFEFEPNDKKNKTNKGFFIPPNDKRETARWSSDAVKYGKTAEWKCQYQKPYEKTIGDSIKSTSNSIGDTISSWFKDEDD